MSSREERKKEKLARKGLKVMRLRWLKNLIWWFSGVLSCIAILAGAVLVGVKLIPLKSYLGENSSDYVSDEISEKSLVDALLGLSSNKLGDIPVLANTFRSLMEESGLNNYITVDYDKLNQVKFTYESGDTNLAAEIQNCITVTATIDSMGGTEMLGDLGTLSIFSTREEVIPDTTAEDFNPKLYYYQKDDGTQARAFKDDGSIVEDAESKTLFYPALATVPLVELKDIISDRMGTMTVKSLLKTFGEVSEDNVIVKILGEKKVSEIGAFKAEEVLLTDVLEKTADNEMVFDILCEAVVIGAGETKPTANELNLGHVGNIDINKVPLITIIKKDDNSKELYDVLCSALSTAENPVVAPEDVVIGDLNAIDTDNIELTSVLPYEAKSDGNPGKNVLIYDILMQATNKPSPSKIKVADLNGFNVNNVKLTTVLPVSAGNEKLYDILEDIYNTEDAGTITIADLNGFNVNNVKLATVLPLNTNNEKLYDILKDVYNTGDAGTITIADLNSFNVENVKLVTVLPINTNNEKLYDILKDVYNIEDAGTITIANLNNFNVSGIKLKTVMGSSENPILSALLADDTVTVGNLGVKINGLSLHDVYGKSCFVEGGTGTDKYTMTEVDGKEVYTLDNTNGTYTRNSDAGIWLLMCYDSEDSDSDGKTDVYTESNLSVQDLQDGGNNITSRLSGATVQQLIDAGIIDGASITNSYLLKMTLQAVIETANTSLSGS